MIKNCSLFFHSDDEDAVVHGILTADNLFDGTITTKLEHFYVEPASKYSSELPINSGIHSIVYKVSDVDMHQHNGPSPKGGTADHYCASERLRKKSKNEFKRRRKSDSETTHSDDHTSNKVRRKRFMQEEVSQDC